MSVYKKISSILCIYLFFFHSLVTARLISARARARLSHFHHFSNEDVLVRLTVAGSQCDKKLIG